LPHGVIPDRETDPSFPAAGFLPTTVPEDTATAFNQPPWLSAVIGSITAPMHLSPVFSTPPPGFSRPNV